MWIENANAHSVNQNPNQKQTVYIPHVADPNLSMPSVFSKIVITQDLMRCNHFIVEVYGLEESLMQLRTQMMGMSIQTNLEEYRISLSGVNVFSLQLIAEAGRIDPTIPVHQIAMPIYLAEQTARQLASRQGANASSLITRTRPSIAALAASPYAKTLTFN